MTGYIHSTESFGTVDGPGVRYVLFMQGCPMRCLYCHNPDTQKVSGGKAVTAEEILNDFKKNEVFYKNGGITVSGGEPLLQIDFLCELFSLFKSKGIHTCIDTSGITFDKNNAEFMKKLDSLLGFTDLILLDIKHIDSVSHKKLTGFDNKNILEFAKHLNIPVWIRHVVVPGFTDRKEDLIQLGEFIGTLKSLKALDVIPYHTMGVSKYKELGMDYALLDVAPATLEQTKTAKAFILQGIKNAKKRSDS